MYVKHGYWSPVYRENNPKYQSIDMVEALQYLQRKELLLVFKNDDVDD